MIVMEVRFNCHLVVIVMEVRFNCHHIVIVMRLGLTVTM